MIKLPRIYTFFDLMRASVDEKTLASSDFMSCLPGFLIKLSLHSPLNIHKASAIVFSLQSLMSDATLHYHTIVHILGGLSFAQRSGLQLSTVEELAFIFHDAFYDPSKKRGENEKTSADFMYSILSPYVTDAVLQPAYDLILATSLHDKEDVPQSAHLLLDLDVSNFALDYDTVSRANKAIKEEFCSYISSEDYNHGRAEFLGELLKRPAFFRSAPFQKWNATAKENLMRSAGLD